MTDLNLAFWNVQNLFEPASIERGPKTEFEVVAKAGMIASVVNEFFGGKGPHLLALAEIHTERIFHILRERLEGAYRPLWEASAGAEGTGLGILAREDMFAELESVAVQRPTMFARPRCLIARCKFKQQVEPILLAVNHWKSRMPAPGVNPEQERAETAQWLGEWLAESQEDTCAIVVGDFNAEPFEAPFGDHALRTRRFFSSVLWSGATPAYLYNTAWRFLPEPEHWEVVQARGAEYRVSRPRTSHDASPSVLYDQLLVSGRALETGPITLRESTVTYYCEGDTALWKRGGQVTPRRWAYADDGTHTGISDHFPLLAAFQVNGV